MLTVVYRSARVGERRRQEEAGRAGSFGHRAVTRRARWTTADCWGRKQRARTRAPGAHTCLIQLVRARRVVRIDGLLEYFLL